jgi:formamidopyrimidine-DNA glycosylase
MPELPDVETFRRYLDSTALHQRIREVAVNDTHPTPRISRKVCALRTA